MDDPEPEFRISDGVRRAKAAELCGHETISAQIGSTGQSLNLPLRNLYAPYAEVDTLSIRGMDWGRILRATQRGQPLPPILVEPGNNGIPLRDVTIQEDDWDVFRRSAGTA